MAEATYCEKARGLVNQAAADCAATGERMDKLNTDLEELISDLQLDVLDRFAQTLQVIALEHLPWSKIEEAVVDGRTRAERRQRVKLREPPMEEACIALVNELLGRTLGGSE